MAYLDCGAGQFMYSTCVSIPRRLASVRLRNSTPVCRLEGLLHFALVGGLVHGWEVLAFEN